jgi:hypothetical protein
LIRHAVAAAGLCHYFAIPHFSPLRHYAHPLPPLLITLINAALINTPFHAAGLPASCLRALIITFATPALRCRHY